MRRQRRGAGETTKAARVVALRYDAVTLPPRCQYAAVAGTVPLHCSYAAKGVTYHGVEVLLECRNRVPAEGGERGTVSAR